VRGVPLTREQEETILRVWYETRNASEAARQAGVAEHAARLALQRLREAKRGELHARALAKVERQYRRTVAKNLSRIETRLDGVKSTKAFCDATKALHDGLRTLSQVRIAHAKLTGEHAPEQQELTLAAKVALLPALDADTDDPLASEPGTADPVPRDPGE
jgi:hypothetical protein